VKALVMKGLFVMAAVPVLAPLPVAVVADTRKPEVGRDVEGRLSEGEARGDRVTLREGARMTVEIRSRWSDVEVSDEPESTGTLLRSSRGRAASEEGRRRSR
jgi:hypothetical protein